MEAQKQRPKIGIGVYIKNSKGEILLMKRKGKHGGETWCPPGGHLEMGESFLDCARRETKEEVGLEVEDVEVIGAVNNIFSQEVHYVNVDVIAKGVLGEPKIMEPEKCSEIAWFALNNLPKPLFYPTEHLLEVYPEALKQ
jgi:8-oxo-dGTP diphosphatase